MDMKCGNHAVVIKRVEKHLLYYGTPICVMNTATKTYYQPNKGYSQSTSKAQTQYRNTLNNMGYEEVEPENK